jgi:hypothetical protein
VGIEMAEEGKSFLSPQPPVSLFAVGDMVHVFEGTGVGKEVFPWCLSFLLSAYNL